MEKPPCLISCKILKEEIETLIESGRLNVEPFFLSSKFHNDYNLLEKGLRGEIEKRKKEFGNRIVVLYGDVCLGFDYEMKALVEDYGLVKVDAINCLDCFFGGKGKLLEIDPDHKYFFLNPAFIHFLYKTFVRGTREEVRERFRMLDGIILVDPLNNLDQYQKDIDMISEKTGLPVIDRMDVGLDKLCAVIQEAVDKLD
jgi:hypothetical protein